MIGGGGEREGRGREGEIERESEREGGDEKRSLTKNGPFYNKSLHCILNDTRCNNSYSLTLSLSLSLSHTHSLSPPLFFFFHTQPGTVTKNTSPAPMVSAFVILGSATETMIATTDLMKIQILVVR